MKFVIDSVTKCSGRLGKITLERLPGLELKTPLLILNTKVRNNGKLFYIVLIKKINLQGASIPHISREVLDLLLKDNFNAIEICFSNTENMKEAVKEYKKGIASFSGLSNFLSFLTLKDPSETSPSGFHERDSVPVFTRVGKLNITSDRYMDVVEAFKPDFYHNLCDGDTKIDSAKKRVLRSFERTNGFLQKCIERHRSSENLKNSMFIGTVEGGYLEAYRERSIKELLKYEEIQGFLIDGLHTNGPEVAKLKTETIKKIVGDSIISLLPTDKLKIMLGSYNPVVVLEMIKLGVDIFDSTYPYLATVSNKALTFNFKLKEMSKNAFDLDLTDVIYKESFIPFLEDCSCLSCSKHTRAYTHHLITTKEMLAPILLMM